MENAVQFEFQRVHRFFFLKCPQREEVMSNNRKLKGKNFGISPDLPSESLERRKKKVKQFKQAKNNGNTASFIRAGQDIPLINRE